MTTDAKPKSKEAPTRAELYERIVRDAMERLRWSRKKAETAATKLMKRMGPKADPITIAGRLDAIDPRKESPKLSSPGAKKLAKKQRAPAKSLTRAQIAKLPPVDPPRPPPRNALERLERALGPDDGKRRRGGSPVVQGGIPGLGRRS